MTETLYPAPGVRTRTRVPPQEEFLVLSSGGWEWFVDWAINLGALTGARNVSKEEKPSFMSYRKRFNAQLFPQLWLPFPSRCWYSVTKPVWNHGMMIFPWLPDSFRNSLVLWGWGGKLSSPTKARCVLQEACLQGNLIAICLEQLNDPHPLLRQWVAICLGRIWQNFDSARWCGVRDSAHEKLYSLLSDPIPEVKTKFLLSRRQSFVFVSASEKDLAAVPSRWCKSNKPYKRSFQRRAGGAHRAPSPWELGTALRKCHGFCFLAYQKLLKMCSQNSLCSAK